MKIVNIIVDTKTIECVDELLLLSLVSIKVEPDVHSNTYVQEHAAYAVQNSLSAKATQLEILFVQEPYFPKVKVQISFSKQSSYERAEHSFVYLLATQVAYEALLN